MTSEARRSNRKDTPPRIHHVAAVVKDIKEARRFYRRLGFRVGTLYTVREQYPEEIHPHTYRGCSIRSQGGGPSIWLMQPVGKRGPLARFLKERGGGLHHLGIGVRSVRDTHRRLSKSGARFIREPNEFPLDAEIRALVHPKDTSYVLLELVQRLK